MLGLLSPMKMEAVHSSETLVDVHQITQHYIQNDISLNIKIVLKILMACEMNTLAVRESFPVDRKYEY
jgi:hypothetical protein